MPNMEKDSQNMETESQNVETESHNMENDSQNFKPVLLMPNVSYPAYQLYALAGKESSDPETVLKICVLETAAWLRERFREIDIPEALKLPGPEEAKTFSLDQLSSGYSDVGYHLQIIWLSEERIWTLQLEEPDLGPSPGTGRPGRAPVPGRLFETNISYRIDDGRVECGFLTVVSEPEGTDAECEVYRYSCIKNIARNKDAGLWQEGWQLKDEAHYVKFPGHVARLADWIEDEYRMAPAVIISEYSEDVDDKADNTGDRDIVAHMEQYLKEAADIKNVLFDSIVTLGNEIADAFSESETLIEPKIKQTLAKLPRYRMGFAQYFTLDPLMRKFFEEECEIRIDNGEIIIIDPIEFGSGIQRFSYNRVKKDTTGICEKINDYTGAFPKGKDFDFGGCIFVPEASIVQLDRLLRQHDSTEEVVTDLEKGHQSQLKEHTRKEAVLQQRIIAKDKEIEKYIENVKGLEQKNINLTRTFKEREERIIAAMAQKDEYIAWLKTLEARPSSLAKVAGWVESRFPDRMAMHKRAQDCLKKTGAEKADLKLICDALEYLATDYYLEVTGKIDEEKRGENCSLKYGRPFDVSPLTGVAAGTKPEYRVKYDPGNTGKPKERRLDLHLKVGNDSENLLRIYFFYDKERQLIVVGHLPDHLPI